MRKLNWVLLAAMAVFTLRTAESPAGSKGLDSELANDSASFEVHLAVDQEDATYRVGQLLRATVRSDRAGYLYLLHEDTERNVSVVFPNKFQSSGWIPAATPVQIPAADSDFQLRVTLPVGSERLMALVSARRIEALEREGIREQTTTRLPQFLSQVKVPLVQELATRHKTWSGDFVDITIDAGHAIQSQVSPNREPARRQSAQPELFQRTLIAVGIGNGFRDDSIRALRAGARDAQAFAEVMQEFGQVDHAIVLLNDQATKGKIRQAFQEAVRLTAADGEVFVYFSSHGIRVAADRVADEADGFSEAIVCADSRMPAIGANTSSVILDRELAGWIDGLGGRKVVAVFDMCHAGGFASKSVTPFAQGLIEETERLLSRRFAAKNISRVDTAILASSQETELSFEQRTGLASVMTYELVKMLRSSHGPITVSRAAAEVSPKVARYVADTFGVQQRPVFVDRLTSSVYFKLR